jgi:hypothetical protein
LGGEVEIVAVVDVQIGPDPGTGRVARRVIVVAVDRGQVVIAAVDGSVEEHDLGENVARQPS